MEAALDPTKVILDEIAALEVERGKTEAKITAKMLDFEDLRRTQAESNERDRCQARSIVRGR